MPPKHKQLTIYPDPTARLIVGGNSPACNRAVECWGLYLRGKMPELSREEWNYLADTLNGTYIMQPHDWGPQALALEAHDSHQLNRTGDKWFKRRADDRAAGLVEKIQSWDWGTVQYVLTAVAFFWDEPAVSKIDHQKDEWWTIPFRVQTLSEADEADE